MKPDWKNAPEWANWWAMDESGVCWWYEIEPYKSKVANVFNESGGKFESDRSNNWAESLQKRPKC